MNYKDLEELIVPNAFSYDCSKLKTWSCFCVFFCVLSLSKFEVDDRSVCVSVILFINIKELIGHFRTRYS